jgi:hypothetical protein
MKTIRVTVGDGRDGRTHQRLLVVDWIAAARIVPDHDYAANGHNYQTQAQYERFERNQGPWWLCVTWAQTGKEEAFGSVPTKPEADALLDTLETELQQIHWLTSS